MTDNAFNIEIIFIGGGFGTRQHEFGVKDIEAFILHRAHVEEINGDDHVDI